MVIIYFFLIVVKLKFDILTESTLIFIYLICIIDTDLGDSRENLFFTENQIILIENLISKEEVSHKNALLAYPIRNYIFQNKILRIDFCRKRS